MRKLKFLLVAAAACFVMSSCYTSKVAVGDVDVNGPSVKVNSKKNHFFISGLIHAGNKQQGANMVGGRENYIIKTSHTFLDGLIAFVTASIYTPTTTTYYLPIDNNSYEISPSQNNKPQRSGFYNSSTSTNNYSPQRPTNTQRENKAIEPEPQRNDSRQDSGNDYNSRRNYRR